MELAMTQKEEAFRDEVRAFIDSNLPPECKSDRIGGLGSRDLLTRWHKALHKQGWVAPNWPTEFGGTGWSAMQKHIYNDEAASANAPRLPPFGLGMVGPVIYTYGNEEQKAQHLPGILNGDVWWCQGYSEPGSGSDLASLRTAAVQDGDDYIVNGHKIWTSSAHNADWIFCLVRTKNDGKPQEGISFLLIPMTTPGIEVRPIISIDGLHHLNEVFFTDVRVPIKNRIGEENKGWTYAKYLLVHERTGIAGVPESKKQVERVVKLAAERRDGDGRALNESEDFKRKLAEIEVKLTSLEYANLRVLSDMEAGQGAGSGSSILKVVGTEVQQALTEMAMEVIAFYAAPFQKDLLEGQSNEAPIGTQSSVGVAANYNFLRAASIYGGSNEIQRNVVAKAVLGL